MEGLADVGCDGAKMDAPNDSGTALLTSIGDLALTVVGNLALLRNGRTGTGDWALTFGDAALNTCPNDAFSASSIDRWSGEFARALELVCAAEITGADELAAELAERDPIEAGAELESPVSGAPVANGRVGCDSFCGAAPALEFCCLSSLFGPGCNRGVDLKVRIGLGEREVEVSCEVRGLSCGERRVGEALRRLRCIDWTGTPEDGDVRCAAPGDGCRTRPGAASTVPLGDLRVMEPP